VAERLDIIIPVYNEGKNILPVLESLKADVKTPIRILLCYDKDDDDTLPAAKGFVGTFEVIPVKNTGKGAHSATLAGFDFSDAPAVMMMPADDDFNAPIVDEMWKRFKEGADIVSASRFMPGGCMEGAPFLKNTLVRLSSWAMYALAGVPTPDASNGLRLFSRKLLGRVKIESTLGFSWSIELLVKCHRLGWRIDSVPAKWFERTSGSSRFKILSWLPDYLRWFFYAFKTTWFRRGADSVI